MDFVNLVLMDFPAVADIAAMQDNLDAAVGHPIIEVMQVRQMAGRRSEVRIADQAEAIDAVAIADLIAFVAFVRDIVSPGSLFVDGIEVDGPAGFGHVIEQSLGRIAAEAIPPFHLAVCQAIIPKRADEGIGKVVGRWLAAVAADGRQRVVGFVFLVGIVVGGGIAGGIAVMQTISVGRRFDGIPSLSKVFDVCPDRNGFDIEFIGEVAAAGRCIIEAIQKASATVFQVVGHRMSGYDTVAVYCSGRVMNPVGYLSTPVRQR